MCNIWFVCHRAFNWKTLIRGDIQPKQRLVQIRWTARGANQHLHADPQGHILYPRVPWNLTETKQNKTGVTDQIPAGASQTGDNFAGRGRLLFSLKLIDAHVVSPAAVWRWLLGLELHGPSAVQQHLEPPDQRWNISLCLVYSGPFFFRLEACCWLQTRRSHSWVLSFPLCQQKTLLLFSDVLF